VISSLEFFLYVRDKELAAPCIANFRPCGKPPCRIANEKTRNISQYCGTNGFTYPPKGRHTSSNAPLGLNRLLGRKNPPMGCTGLALHYCMSSTVCTNFYRNRMSCGPELDIQKITIIFCTSVHDGT